MSNPETQDDGVTSCQPPTCPLVFPEKFDGIGNFKEWINHFESISAVNNWNEEEKPLDTNLINGEGSRGSHATSV